MATETTPVAPAVPYVPLPPITVGWLTAPRPPSVYPLGAAAGVAMNAPASELLPSISAAIAKAATAIPAGHTGALVGVICPTGTNLALVKRIGDDVTVTAWLGRTWGVGGAWDYGASVLISL